MADERVAGRAVASQLEVMGVRMALLQVTTVPGHSSSAAVRIYAVGELDQAGAPLLDDALATAAEQGHDEIHVDLSAVTFLDCAGLRALHLTGPAASRRVRLVAASAPVRRVMALLDLQHRLPAA